MQKMKPAESPDAYVAALGGWRRGLVEALRQAVRSAGKFDEVIKWGHLVYFDNGPVLLIRAEEERVLFGFWRGQRLRDLEARLKPGGKYEMATIELREGMALAPAVAKKLAKAAAGLNHEIGDPTAIVSTGVGVEKAATKKAATRKPSLSPSGSVRKTPR